MTTTAGTMVFITLFVMLLVNQRSCFEQLVISLKYKTATLVVLPLVLHVLLPPLAAHALLLIHVLVYLHYRYYGSVSLVISGSHVVLLKLYLHACIYL